MKPCFEIQKHKGLCTLGFAFGYGPGYVGLNFMLGPYSILIGFDR